jgi:multicomponent K+:H+ antiporter subunit E
MNRLLPAPATSAGVFAIWILLNGHGAGHLLLGALLALALPWLVPALRAGPSLRLHAPGTLLGLAGTVLRDIVVANLQVAARVLGPEDRIHPGYVRVPLALRDPNAIAALASIVTMTPGTLSAALEDGGRTLLVHCLHLEDAQATVDEIKQRYEAPLARIFADLPQEHGP